MERRHQVNITITPEQVQMINENHGKMTNKDLARKIGVTYNKTLNNLRLMGLYNPDCKGIVVEMGEYFDIDKFKKYYEY